MKTRIRIFNFKVPPDRSTPVSDYVEESVNYWLQNQEDTEILNFEMNDKYIVIMYKKLFKE